MANNRCSSRSAPVKTGSLCLQIIPVTKSGGSCGRTLGYAVTTCPSPWAVHCCTASIVHSSELAAIVGPNLGTPPVGGINLQTGNGGGSGDMADCAAGSDCPEAGEEQPPALVSRGRGCDQTRMMNDAQGYYDLTWAP